MGDLSVVVGLMSTAVAGLAGAVAHLFVVFRVELTDCKKDRAVLFAEATKNQAAIEELRQYVNDIRQGKQPPLV